MRLTTASCEGGLPAGAEPPESVSLNAQGTHCPMSSSRLSVSPLAATASHHSIQEFFVAKAICDGVRLPHPPWAWDEWWPAVVMLGAEMGDAFKQGLPKWVGSNAVAHDDLVTN